MKLFTPVVYKQGDGFVPALLIGLSARGVASLIAFPRSGGVQRLDAVSQGTGPGQFQFEDQVDHGLITQPAPAAPAAPAQPMAEAVQPVDMSDAPEPEPARSRRR